VSERTFAYSIDRDDLIESVSDSWLEFARENRAPELTREHVVGQILWRFVAGRETRLLYEDLFLKVRTRAESLALPFRCDSPDRFRFMRLMLDAGPRDSIDCRGILIREQQRPYLSILDQAFPRTNDSLPMCSCCNRIHAFGTQWLDAEDAIRRLDLFDSASLPQLEYAVCDACAAINRSTPNDGADVVP